MLRKFKYDYDYENDSLFLYNPKTKSKASIELDDLIVDFNSRREISALELLNASKYIKDLGVDVVVTKDLLKEIVDAQVEVITKNNFFVIKFMILFKSQECISTPILVPTISEPSPAIA